MSKASSPRAVANRWLLAKTCRKCGHLKQGHMFGIRSTGYRESWCKRCKSKNTLERYHSNKEYKKGRM